ncbi:MAG: thioredoxin family protein [Cytophaga sp.]
MILTTPTWVKGVPTMILFKQGKIVWRGSGYMDEGQLSKTLAAFC